MVGLFRRLGNAAFLVTVSIASMCGCASDQRIVRDGVAAREYYEARYQRLCVAQAGPSTCKPCQEAANDLASEIRAANESQKIGRLPKRARASLKDATKKLEAVCP